MNNKQAERLQRRLAKSKARQVNKAKKAQRGAAMKVYNAPSQVIKMNIREIEAKTQNQEFMFDSFEENDVTVVHGFPGTGKSFVALYLALSEIEYEPELYKRVLIIRSPQQSRDIGFQPGNYKEKIAEFEAPYIDMVNELYGRSDAYNILKQKGVIEFTSTSFLRGMTFRDTIVIVDEAQNNPYKDLKTIVTRFGDNCKMIITGDTGQDDLTSERYKEQTGLVDLIQVLKDISGVGFIEMGVEDIVRSGFVKKFIISEFKHFARKRYNEA